MADLNELAKLARPAVVILGMLTLGQTAAALLHKKGQSNEPVSNKIAETVSNTMYQAGRLAAAVGVFEIKPLRPTNSGPKI